MENRLQQVRDVTFDEDRCQVRTRHGPRVLASLRNLIIGPCRRMITSPRTSIPSVLRYFAARPAEAPNGNARFGQSPDWVRTVFSGWCS